MYVHVTRHSSLVTRHTSQVLVVGYQQAEFLRPLVQELHRTQLMAAIVVNEVQVLDEKATWRDVKTIPNFMGHLVRLELHAVVVFMTATLPNPARTLEICGFRPPFDEALFESPMRANLAFQHQFLAGGTNGEVQCDTSYMPINVCTQRHNLTR